MDFNTYFFQSKTMVKVIVGRARVTWVLPEDLLCDKFRFFQAAFKGGFAEATAKEIYLEEDDPVAFGKLLDWVFLKKYTCKDADLFDPESWGGEPSECIMTQVNIDYQLLYCKVFVLANKLACHEFADETAHRFASRSLIEDADIGIHGSSIPSAQVITYAYENTTGGSRLREVLVESALDYFLSRSNENTECFSEAMAAHPSFTEDVCAAMKRHMHEKDEGEMCCIWDCGIHYPCRRPLSL